MPIVKSHISQTLLNLLQEKSHVQRESISHIVSTTLSQSFGVPMHTLFQVSTSGALVQGIYERAVSSRVLLRHGDFGLGTFESLDGEMVILENRIYQVRSDGSVREVGEDVGTPFAVVVPFVADRDEKIAKVNSFQSLSKMCDPYRESDNLFYAIRVDGRFSRLHNRAMHATAEGVPLIKAAATQPEFEFQDVCGTLVGIWAPQFSSALNVAGYHFHFLSDDRTKGGHVLDCAGENLRLRVEKLNDFHLSLPESEEFLRADLTRDTSRDLLQAEQLHRPGEAQ